MPLEAENTNAIRLAAQKLTSFANKHASTNDESALTGFSTRLPSTSSTPLESGIRSKSSGVYVLVSTVAMEHNPLWSGGCAYSTARCSVGAKKEPRCALRPAG